MLKEIDQWLRLPPESRPELMLEPFHYSLLNVLFIDFNQNKQGGQCWACGAAFGTYQELMHHFKVNGHDRLVGTLFREHLPELTKNYTSRTKRV